MTSILFLNAVNAMGFPLGKYLLIKMSPYALCAARFILSGILLYTIRYFYESYQRIQIKDALQIFPFAFWSIFVSMIFGAWALQYLSAAIASFYYNLSPFFTAIMAYLHGAERITFKKVLGLCVGFVGFLPIILSQDISGARFSLADGALLISVITYAYGWIIVQKLIKSTNYSALTINGFGMFWGGIMCLLVTLWMTPSYNLPVLNAIDLSMLGANILNGVIAFMLYSALLKTYSATFLSFTSFTMPIFAALYGWLFLGETITISLLIATVIVAIGLYIFYQEELLDHK